MKIRALSYNIHKGFSIGNTQFVLHEMRELLRSTEVDIVFLQEVIGNNEKNAKLIKKWPKESQYEFLADQVWDNHCYGKNAVHPKGHHGNAILSRFPIACWENLNISTNRLEKRGLLHTKIRIPETDLAFHACCTHLDLTMRGRVKQVKKLCEFISKTAPENAPLILAGDFNDLTDQATPVLKKEAGLAETVFEKHGRLHATFPSMAPLLCLDRIYQRGFKVTESRILKERVWKKLSDHLPVYAVLSFE